MNGIRNLSPRVGLVIIGVIIVAVAIGLFGLVRFSDRTRQGEILITRIRTQANRLSLLEWQSIAQLSVKQDLLKKVADTRNEFSQTMNSLTNLHLNLDKRQQMVAAWDTYNAWMDKELQLIGTGDRKQAQTVDEEHVDPAFANLDGILDTIASDLMNQGKYIRKTSILGAISLVLGSGLLIGLLTVKNRRTIVAMEVLHAEQRTLKLSEEKLQGEKNKLSSVIGAMSSFLTIRDRDYTITYHSPRTEELFGNFIGKKCYQVFGHDEKICDGCPVELAFRDAQSHRAIREVVSPDGRITYIENVANPIQDASGEIVACLEISTDITEQKWAERDLFTEKERLLVTLKSIGDGVITTDEHGKITLVNTVAEELTGWSFAEVLGRPLSEVFPIINELTRERCENPVEKVLKSECIVGLANHTVLIRRDGTEIILADSAAPIRDRESAIVGVVLVFRDITEKEKTEQALKNAQKLEAVGALAAGIAHDFNNLLSGIFGYLDLAREQAEKGDGDGAAKTLYKGLDVFDRAKRLTQELLTFSKGGLPIRKTLSIAEHVKKTATFALSGSNVSPVFSVAPDVWPCDIDENQMAQVFDNIVINARQAMPLGGKLDITVSNITPGAAPKMLPPHAYVRISIRDYGTGIIKEHLPRIFDPFFTTKQQGSGLGLATSYSIVRKHDGMIEVESEQGKGTTFHVYLPASAGQLTVAEEVTMPLHKGQGRVLVMDDEAFVLDVASQMLTTMGYEVITARDGDEAIALARRAEASGEKLSAAILDLTIPGGRGGKEISAELLQIDEHLKMIASSGYSEDPVMSHPADYGFTERLKKPYRKRDLVKLMESLSNT